MARQPQTLLTKAVQRQLRGDTPRERLLHRLHTVVLVLNGHSASEVANIYNDSPRAVAYWVSRFNEKGMIGLQEEQRPGRPSKLSDRQMNKLQTVLRRAKQKSESINAKTLAALILSKFEILLTTRQCWRILSKLRS
jgi:transposase